MTTKAAHLWHWVGPQGERCQGSPADHLHRTDGRIERVCQHGVGHPVGHVQEWKPWMAVHGCDGCCAAWRVWPHFTIADQETTT